MSDREAVDKKADDARKNDAYGRQLQPPVREARRHRPLRPHRRLSANPLHGERGRRCRIKRQQPLLKPDNRAGHRRAIYRDVLGRRAVAYRHARRLSRDGLERPRIRATS